MAAPPRPSPALQAHPAPQTTPAALQPLPCAAPAAHPPTRHRCAAPPAPCLLRRPPAPRISAQLPPLRRGTPPGWPPRWQGRRRYRATRRCCRRAATAPLPRSPRRSRQAGHAGRAARAACKSPPAQHAQRGGRAGGGCWSALGRGATPLRGRGASQRLVARRARRAAWLGATAGVRARLWAGSATAAFQQQKATLSHPQLLHGRVGQGGGVLPLAVALGHAEERVEVKRLQPAGVRKASRHLQPRGHARGAGGCAAAGARRRQASEQANAASCSVAGGGLRGPTSMRCPLIGSFRLTTWWLISRSSSAQRRGGGG